MGVCVYFGLLFIGVFVDLIKIVKDKGLLVICDVVMY